MIKLEKVCKTYHTQNEDYHALTDIDLILPDNGLVFIIGKSGSGKSTLLNLLSGLDEITSGDIVSDGNRFSTFDENDFNNYRNMYAGIIFQDYCLINDFTVEQNVLLSAELQRKNDCNIDPILKKVGLEGLNDRYPNQLSGGQKQRVAIARTLLKNPKVILADEPTGNLDSKTSSQILDLLKEISKEKLVIIVSHNYNDAITYGDRIIELKDGRVFHDVNKTSDDANNLEINDDQILLPYNKPLKEEEIKLVNEIEKDRFVPLGQKKDNFTETEINYSQKKRFRLNKKAIKLKHRLKISMRLAHHKLANYIFMIILVSLLVSLFGLCQQLGYYNGSSTVKDIVSSQNVNNLVLQKGYRTENENLYISYTIPVEDSDYYKFENSSYNGHIYKLNNFSVPIVSTSAKYYYGSKYDSSNYNTFYPLISEGVLVCDYQYLLEEYGIDGKVEVLSGDLNALSYGVILTDYQADGLLYSSPELITTSTDPYENITSGNLIRSKYRVNAVIKTDYLEKYGTLLRDMQLASEEKYQEKDLTAQILASDEYLNFSNDARCKYNISFSMNTSFIDDVIDNSLYTTEDGVIAADYTYDENGDFLAKNVQPAFRVNYGDKENNTYLGTTLNDGEIAVSSTYYNNLFGTSITDKFPDGFKERTIKICSYGTNPSSTEFAFIKEFKITSIYTYTGGGNTIICSQNDFAFLKHQYVFNYELVFDDVSNINNIILLGQDLSYVSPNTIFTSINTINNVMNIFNDVFKIIIIILLASVLIILTYFGFKTIKNKYYEIGVIKSLGGSTKSISKIFLLQIVLSGLLIFGLSIIFSYILTLVINKILIKSLAFYYSSKIIPNLQILFFNFPLILIDLIVVMTATITASIIPLFITRKVKPINIIKARE